VEISLTNTDRGGRKEGLSVKRTSATEYETLPQVARRLGIGIKTLRRAAKEGAIPVYYAGTSWPRVKFTEAEAWLRSTRAKPRARAGPAPIP